MFVWPVRVYWEDTDAGGIVFYANYLKFMERARTEWLRSLGVSQSRLRETTQTQTGGMFVVADTQLHYKLPARLDDQLLVTAQIVKKSRITLTIAQEITLQKISTFPTQNIDSLLLNNEFKDASSPNSSPPSSPSPVVCTGMIRIAWVDAHSFKPSPIPPHVLEVLQ